ncbi:MAG: hypothetical protein OEY16_10135 [Alphaproteobacteria bacterium]|nr:hypothetical protein [Alphaproteobacteria bacterium]
MKFISPVALAIIILAAPAPTAPAQAAGFDCAQAGTAVEHLICGDEALSKLDELLGDRYVRALKKGEDPRALKAAPHSGQCDHGRPTCVALKLADIERLFGRR